MKTLLKYLFLFTFFISYSQNGQDLSNISNDVFDASYTVRNNTLFKTHNNKTVSYQNLAFGDITSVDNINSLEIVVFYRDYNTAVILDNQLNKINEIAFSETTVLFASKGIVNTIWIYNDSKHKLELYDYKSKRITSSSQVITNFSPLKMESNFNSVKLIGANKTLIFDQYLNLTDTVVH